MAKYLFQGGYSEAGLERLVKEGGTARREAVEKALQGMGGTLEAFYYMFGGEDVLILFDLPGPVDATIFSVMAAIEGQAKGATTVLITPEEMDAASERIKAR